MINFLKNWNNDEFYSKYLTVKKEDMNILDRLHYNYTVCKLAKMFRKNKEKYKRRKSLIDLITAMEYLTDGITCVCDNSNKKFIVRIWVKFNSIYKLNKFLWGCCYRWTTINRWGLWNLKIANGDTDISSKSIDCYLESSEEIFDKEINKMAVSLTKFILEYRPSLRFRLFKNHIKYKLRHLWWSIRDYKENKELKKRAVY